MQTTTKKRFTARKTIALSEELLRFALARAKGDNRSFSGYVQNLIARDARGAVEAAVLLNDGKR